MQTKVARQPAATIVRITTLLALAFACAASLSAQVRRGNGIYPPSSIERPADVGVRMHTNYIILCAGRSRSFPLRNPVEKHPLRWDAFTAWYPTALPAARSRHPPHYLTGGGGVIVIVDAYDYPSAAADLSTFSSTFGLPQANFTVQYASGRKPSNGCSTGWQGEEALDIEWAHAMAPQCCDRADGSFFSPNTALYQAVTAANSYIASHGGKGEMSMSWGGSETSGESSSDHYFTQSGVVYFASSGDSPGVIYPSSSPNVVRPAARRSIAAAAATTPIRQRGATAGAAPAVRSPSFLPELYPGNRRQPSAAHRTFPSTPAAARPSRCITPTATADGLQVYGTSVASPSLAGIINSAGQFKTSSNAENTLIYSNMGFTTTSPISLPEAAARTAQLPDGISARE